MAHTISRSPLFRNRGIRLKRTIARGEYVADNQVSLQKVVQDAELEFLDRSGIVDLVEGTLMHFGFVPSAQGPNDRSNSYDVVFKRGTDELCLQLPSGNGAESFVLRGNTKVLDQGTLSPDGTYILFSPSEIVRLINHPFPDDVFFERFAGMPGLRNPHPLYDDFSRRAGAVVETFRRKQPGSLGTPNSDGHERIYIDGRVQDVDLTGFLPIINRRTARKQDGIASLAGMKNLLPFPYGHFSREKHMITAFYVMRLMCDRFGIEGPRRTKNLVHALVHDDGHTFYGHPGEDYFKYVFRKGEMKFDHEKSSTWHILEERANFDQVMEGLADQVVACFNKTDPDHVLVTADLGGVDRIQFLASDPWHVGDCPKYASTRLIAQLGFDPTAPPDERLWCNDADEAFNFVLFHGQRYEADYYAPQKQTDDAWAKRMLLAAKLEDINDSIPVDFNGFVHRKPLWQLNDDEVTFYLCNRHPDKRVQQIAKYWLLGGLGSPPATVALLKRKGYEQCEGKIQIPRFDRLVFSEEEPLSEGMDPEELNRYYQFWRNPHNQYGLERKAAERLGLPMEWLVIAASPYVEKFVTQKVPVRENGRGPIRQLFDISPRYKGPLQEISYRLQGLRLAIHPQLYDKARAAIEKTPFSVIVREEYEESKKPDYAIKSD